MILPKLLTKLQELEQQAKVDIAIERVDDVIIYTTTTQPAHEFHIYLKDALLSTSSKIVLEIGIDRFSYLSDNMNQMRSIKTNLLSQVELMIEEKIFV